MNELFKKLSETAKIKTEHSLIFDNIILFKDGRALIKAENEEKAKTLMDKYLG